MNWTEAHLQGDLEAMEEYMSQSLGEKRVGVSFNPSHLTAVDDIKKKAAELIDLIAELPAPTVGNEAGEVQRLKALAMTDFETGAMYAVKAAVKGSTNG